MTNLGDVIRQIETVMSDRCDPPTTQEIEVCCRVLSTVFNGVVDPRGSK